MGGRSAQAVTPEQLEAQRAAVLAAIDQRFVSYLEDADKAWDGRTEDLLEDEVRGRPEDLTHEIFSRLEPLLWKPTPVDYIEHAPGGPGHPYPTTGLKSTQFQFDRMNEILGADHWRHLLHYTQNGILCKAVVVVGNNLQNCRLDDDGNLLTYSVVDLPEQVLKVLASQPPTTPTRPNLAIYDVLLTADVIAVREGFGGWKSNSPGDTFKASETNALKRTLARFGPGADVYRVDFEEDTIGILKGESPSASFDASARGSAMRAPQQQRGAGARAARQTAVAPTPSPQPAMAAPAPELTEEQSIAALQKLLAEDCVVVIGDDPVDLQELRNQADDVMSKIPEGMRPSAQQRYQFIAPRKDDPQQLRDLITRAKNAIEQAATGEVMEAESAPPEA